MSKSDPEPANALYLLIVHYYLNKCYSDMVENLGVLAQSVSVRENPE